MLYTPFYCEENIWYFCQEAEFSGLTRRVVCISNEHRACPIWGQRAAPAPNQPVWWDYHVILLCRQDSWMVWDLDTLIGLPVTLGDYLQQAFRIPQIALNRQYAPLFRVIDAEEYIMTFSSDRSHMRDPSGGWLAPPPPWPVIIQEGLPNFAECIDVNSTWIGEVMTFTEFRRNFHESSGPGKSEA